MSTVKFRIVPKKKNGKRQVHDYAPLQLRYSNGRNSQINFNVPLNIYVGDWDNEKQRVKEVKNSLTSPDAKTLNTTLAELKVKIRLDENRISKHKTGEVFDSAWLKKVVADFFNKAHELKKDDTEIDTTLFVTDYMNHWLKNKMESHKAKGKATRLSLSSKQQKRSFVKKIVEFEEAKGKRIEFRRLDNELQSELVLYFVEDKGWNLVTCNNYIGKFKFFVKQAKADGVQVHSHFPSADNFTVGKPKQKTFVTFNMEEVIYISKFDFSNDLELDAVRDWFVIALNSGMAFSDLRALDFQGNVTQDFHIKSSRIKTGTDFVVPPFQMIKDIFDKHDGLPPMNKTKSKNSDNKHFNEKLQEICRLMGFTEKTEFPVYYYNWETGKRTHGKAPKWAAVTSHCARRSFATNMSRKDENGVPLLDNTAIKAIGAWCNDVMINNYNQMTNDEKVKGAVNRVDELQRKLTEKPLQKVDNRKTNDQPTKVIRLNPINNNDNQVKESNQ